MRKTVAQRITRKLEYKAAGKGTSFGADSPHWIANYATC